MATKPPAPNPLARLIAPLQATHARLAPREQRGVSIALWVVALGLLWWLGVAPALSTLRQAPARHAQLDAQLGQMRGMAATASTLRAANTTQPPTRDEVLRLLEQSTASLGGTAKLSVLGDRATLTLNGTSPEGLALWLSQVRINARLVPLEARMTRPPGSPGWNGTVVLAGPGLTS
jgi:general secretion pathway protein M